jgi:hypothetical protein
VAQASFSIAPRSHLLLAAMLFCGREEVRPGTGRDCRSGVPRLYSRSMASTMLGWALSAAILARPSRTNPYSTFPIYNVQDILLFYNE